MEAWMLADLVGPGLSSMTMPSDDAMTEPYPVRRMEIFTGAGHRRTWSPEDKARIVAESYSGLESACSVARRYGLAQTQIFTWRREARTKGLSLRAPPFAPVIVEPASALPAQPRRRRPGRKRRRGGDGGIELEIDGVVMRVA